MCVCLWVHGRNNMELFSLFSPGKEIWWTSTRKSEKIYIQRIRRNQNDTLVHSSFLLMTRNPTNRKWKKKEEKSPQKQDASENDFRFLTVQTKIQPIQPIDLHRARIHGRLAAQRSLDLPSYVWSCVSHLPEKCRKTKTRLRLNLRLFYHSFSMKISEFNNYENNISKQEQ